MRELRATNRQGEKGEKGERGKGGKRERKVLDGDSGIWEEVHSRETLDFLLFFIPKTLIWSPNNIVCYSIQYGVKLKIKNESGRIEPYVHLKSIPTKIGDYMVS